MSGRYFFEFKMLLKETGKISIGMSQEFYYMFQLFLKLNMSVFQK